MTRYNNGAVIERLKRENRELRANLERLRSELSQYHEHGESSALYQTPAQSLRSIQAEAVESIFDKITAIGGRFRAVDIEQYAQKLRNGEDNE